MQATLINIAHKLNKENIPWLLAGKTAAVLQGCFLHSNTLTFYTNQPGAYRFGDFFDEYKREKIKYREASTLAGHTGLYIFNGIEVRVVGDPEILVEKRRFAVPLDAIFLIAEPMDINDEMIPLVPLPWLFVLGILGNDRELVEGVSQADISREKIIEASSMIGAGFYISEQLNKYLK